ncbi:MAG: cupin domain-containing protein [Gammaproteobacteria bacterium]|nr:cupin domain-containing protein [Gammaproteobacteria bacterium]
MPILTTPSGAVALRPTQEPNHDRGGGARTTPLVSPAIGAQGFLNGITDFAPRAAIPFHSHNCEESVLVLEGEAILEIDGEQIALGTLDTTFIPARVSHRFRNASDSANLRIFWTYARADATRTLTDSGETRPIASERAR